MKKTLKQLLVFLAALAVAVTLLASCDHHDHDEENPCNINCSQHPSSGDCHCHGNCGTEGCECHHAH